MKEEKKEEPRPNTWEAVDPKPPVIRSGHLENRIRNYIFGRRWYSPAALFVL